MEGALQDCVMNQQSYERMGELLAEQKGSAVGQMDATCPKCGSLLMKRNGRFGAFWGCSGYSRCRYTRNA